MIFQSINLNKFFQTWYEAHHGNFDAGYQKVKLTGRILISAIDLEDTLLLNLCPALGEDEAEIRLHQGQEIEIIALNEESLHNLKVKAILPLTNTY